ncbi:MAG: hypothetical protein QOH41_4091 [Blastocatellia bacterium]|jgi:hypothetical protein|nr:hypothetical protein [Blastocatellia bacterium]
MVGQSRLGVSERLSRIAKPRKILRPGLFNDSFVLIFR